MNPAITCVALEMTTACDRACPECCCNIPNRPSVHHSWEYFERAAAVIRGVERVHLSGGECTLHPQFEEFVPRFKDLFGCKRLSMVTDGWGFMRSARAILAIASWIDEVHFTDYQNGRRINVETICKAYGIELKIFDAGPNMANFTPRAQIGGGNPCHRHWQQSGQVAYADGKLWGCCVAPGIDRAISCDPFVSIEASTSARFVFIAHPPCERCWFSE